MPDLTVLHKELETNLIKACFQRLTRLGGDTPSDLEETLSALPLHELRALREQLEHCLRSLGGGRD